MADWCDSARAVRRGGLGDERDVRGARAVAVDDGREPLYVGAQDVGERFALGLAQFGELLGDVRHRAVVLADLHAVDRDR